MNELKQSDEYSKHRGPQYQSRVRVCSTQLGMKAKLYIAKCEGGNDFSGFVSDSLPRTNSKILQIGTHKRLF